MTSKNIALERENSRSKAKTSISGDKNAQKVANAKQE